MNIGFSHAAGSYPNRADFLQYGCTQGNAVNPAKMRTVKLFPGDNYAAQYPNQAWSGGPYTSLTELAQDAGWAAVFALPQIERYYLATYSWANTSLNKWTANLAPDLAGVDLDADFTETYDFAAHLLSTYSGKTFIITTVESDWEIMRDTPAFPAKVDVNPNIIRYGRGYFQNRQAAIELARRNVASTSKVLHAIEMNRGLDRNTFRVHRDITHHVPGLDMVTISAYESINEWLFNPGWSQGQLEASIDTRMRAVVQGIRDYNPGVRIAVTDWGWPETMPAFLAGGWSAPGLIARMLATAEDLGLEDAVFWQVFDNSSPYRQQSLYTQASNGTALTASGSYFASL